MAKQNTTLLIVGAAVVVGYILYKKGIIKLPGTAAVAAPSLGQQVAINNTPLLPSITQATVMNPNLSPPITITAPDPTGQSLDLGF